MKRRKRDYPGRAYRKLKRKKAELEYESKVVEAVAGLVVVFFVGLYVWASGGMR